MRIGCIYKISIGKYFIIGSTLDFNKRYKQHLYLLKRGIHYNEFVQNSYNSYKEFNMDIIKEGIPENILTCIEDIWIGASCGKASDNKLGMNIIDAQTDKNRDYSKFTGVKQVKGCIIQYNSDGEYLRTFNSKEEASFFLQFSTNSQTKKFIRMSLPNETKLSNGFIWRYG